MSAVLALLEHLSESDVTWLFGNCRERELDPEDVLIQEGLHPDALYIVLTGLLGVRVAALGEEPIDVSGPGDLLGEISFIDDMPATATVFASEPTHVLVLPRVVLRAHLDEDPAFAARLFQAFARLISARHRHHLSYFAERSVGRDRLQATVDELWQPLAESIDAFKELIRNADIEAIAARGEQKVSEATQAAIFKQFRTMAQSLADGVCLRTDLQDDIRAQLGIRIKRELLPFMLLTDTTERFYSKPRGYAGDFLTIDNVYNLRVSGSGRVGQILDACVVVHEPASKAVRNRRQLIADEIVRAVEALDEDRPLRVTTLAAGPASEIFDAFNRIGAPERLEVTLIDIDAQAIDLVRQRIAATESVQGHIDTVHGNLVYLATGRQRLDLGPQDFVYSMGLIDYFKDRFVIALLDYVYSLLRPGGRVMLGNFHPNTGTRALMDYVFDWKLIFRTEDDLQRLFSGSSFAGLSRVVPEVEGVDLFAEGVRAN